MAAVGTLEGSRENRYAFGDTDQDGFQEVIIMSRTDTTASNYRILEYQCDGSFVTVFTGDPLVPMGVGDFDGDGNHEVLGYGIGGLSIYESVSPTAYPSLKVWQSPPLSNVLGWAHVGDSDRDGNLEIIYTENFFGGTSNLVIFENNGDNTWIQMAAFPLFGNASTGNQVVADLDNDGCVEIAVCGVNGWLYVFESCSNDSWQQTWVDSIGIKNAYAITGGEDTDGNGAPEFFVQGNTPSDPFFLRSFIFEANGDNSFASVASLDVATDVVGLPHNATGDLDLDGKLEYLMLTFRGTFRVYKSFSVGAWRWTDSLGFPAGIGGLYIEDINQTGAPDLLCHSSPTAFLLEHPVPTSLVGPSRNRGTQVTILPHPARGEVTLVAPGFKPAPVTVTVYDARGRLVFHELLEPGTRGKFEWRSGGLAAGVYLLETTQVGRRLTRRAVVLSGR
jgi:hypothetical protein